MPRYRFRDKLLLGFAVLLIVTIVPVLFLVNTQIDQISEFQIEQDLQSAKRVFERFQESQLHTYSEQSSTFVLTQPEVRAEIVTFAEAEDNPFADVFGAAAGGNPFAEGAADEDDPFAAGNAKPAKKKAKEKAKGKPSASAKPPPHKPAKDADDPFAVNEEDHPATGAPSAKAVAATAAVHSEPIAVPGLPERQARILSILQELRFYQSSQVFFLTDYQGRLVFNKTDPALTGERLTELPAVLAALQGNEIFTWWGSLDPHLAESGLLPRRDGQPLLYQMFLKPVIFAGEVKGVVATGTVVTQDVLKQITGITQTDLAFISEGHIYIVSEGSAFPDEQLALLHSGTRQAGRTFFFEREREKFLALEVPALSSLSEAVGSVVVFRSKTKAQQIYENLKAVLNVIGVVALIVAGGLALLISFNFSRSVRALSLGVEEVRKGNLDHKVLIRSRDEFGTLSTAFNEMTAGLKEKEMIRDTFKRYVSSSVVDELLKNGDSIALGGESKQLTIQFSDIAGFTSLSEALTPAQVVEFLNEYLSEMTGMIEAGQGIVDKYIGDAVMAFWGAPLPLEDHALRACRAALEQMAGVRALRRRWAGRGDLSHFKIRLGLHTGEVIVGNIGSSTRMDYTIIGDAVNTASRLEGLNKLYNTEILISESTKRIAGERMLTRELDLIRPVGKQEPVRIYELIAEAGTLPAEEAEQLAARNRLFAEALALYRDGRFEQAIAAFGAAGSSGDGPAQMFVKRCQGYLLQPPPGDWNGVYITRSK